MTTDNTIMFPASKHFDSELHTLGNPEQTQTLIANIKTSIFLLKCSNKSDPNHERRVERARKELNFYNSILQKWNKEPTKTFINLVE